MPVVTSSGPLRPLTLRLFFALWPEAPLRDALTGIATELRSRCGGRMPAPDNIHLTLAFLGAVAETRVPELQALASELRADDFELVLQRIGCWRRQRLVWAGPLDVPPALTALVDQLGAALRCAGFTTERRLFKPHVTLLRDVSAPPAGMVPAPLRWPVTQWVLAASEPVPRGVRYRIIGRWPLTGRAV